MSTTIITTKRREVWNLENIRDPEKAQKAIEAFYFLHGNGRLEKHFTEETDEKRIDILIRWTGTDAHSFDVAGGNLTKAQELEIKRLFFEREVLDYYGFDKPKQY